MTSQLERLAQPFPAAAIRGPAQGKFGSYVPHHVVVQALLAILGPFDLHVGEVFTGNDGKIEGCLVTIVAEVDGRRVSVTEIGDCEQPGNWKTQGARMKDAISDGIKRCSARLGLGLHLWAREDYFLYDQLQKQSQAENAGGRSSQSTSSKPSDDTGDFPENRTPSAISPAVDVGEHPAAANGGEDSSPTASPPTSKNQLQRVQAKLKQLLADNVKVVDRRTAAGLPSLTKDCTAEELDGWERLLDEINAELTAPFERASA